jgi:ABC-type nickel/cobalt efflux system permease component RcnA
MSSLLLLGFMIGMRHALDADHLAAVAAITTQQHSSIRSGIRHGLVWGLGHTITLFLFGSVVIWMDTVIPQQLTNWLQIGVGIMLIALGLDVLRRVIRDRIHYHLHRHDKTTVHLHAHSHHAEPNHAKSKHEHEHHQAFPLRTLFIGLMHGMAGSAALILLTLDTVDTLWLGIWYMLLFGIGSMLGMAILTVIISIPLRATANGLTWMHNGLQTAIGVLTCGLGGSIVYQLS